LKFLRVFGDQYHQAMEENVLFPALLRAVPGDIALLQLVSEHGGEQSLVDDIEKALTSRRGMAFHRSSHQLTSLLRSHCEREGIIVGDLAQRYLSKDQDNEIAARFIACRCQVESHADLSRLERRYLSKPVRDPSGLDHKRDSVRPSASYT
jgi:hemerythrin-like domain-containing protein